MIALYGLSFVVAFVALALWFALKRELAEKYFSRLMFLALILYSMSMVTVHAPMVYKFQTVFRDMLFLGHGPPACVLSNSIIGRSEEYFKPFCRQRYHTQ